MWGCEGWLCNELTNDGEISALFTLDVAWYARVCTVSALCVR